MSTAEQPWHAAFPEPRPTSDVQSITPADLAARLRAGDAGSSKKLVVVDVRRTDFEHTAIRSAINLPAHSFYPTLPGVLRVLSQFEAVVFHCNSCSPGGRGDRCARWYQQAADEAGLSSQTKAYVLSGGIRAWTAEFGEEDEISIRL